jgi:hypothetical protein
VFFCGGGTARRNLDDNQLDGTVPFELSELTVLTVL